MTKVYEIMTSDPVVVHEDASLFEARCLMGSHQVRHLPVTNSDGAMVGLFTQRDLLACTVSILADVDQETQDELERGIPVLEVMTTSLEMVYEDSDVVEVADHFLKHSYSCLPVLEDGRLVGIITESDFIKLSKKLLQEQG
ncbi:MAG: CBS domain-containing protein [Gammaproteobacteria bacterium]|jgi:CBS domain-containing membrane protein|nr:CBS domain-containing protein [Gammaproteobacteria bacterium]MBT7308451.1 CBS domain-containing protein [Gammaproteobacteria bacterium]